MNIEKFFSDEEKEKINQTVMEAEKKTSAEIVPVLTAASSGYNRAEDLFGLFLAGVAISVLWLVFQGVDETESWHSLQSPVFIYGLLPILLTLFLVFTLGAFIAGKVWSIRQLFTSRSLMKDCVRRNAMRAFYEHKLFKTQKATGVLIYLSIYERMVYILGDEKISTKLINVDFTEVKDEIISGFKKGKREDGICDGIKLCGQKLAHHFPIKDGDIDEISNQLRIYKQNL